MTTTAPSLPPRWFIRSMWRAHRTLYRLSRGRLGLSRPKPGRAGMLRLRTVGRVSRLERAVVVCYIEDGPNLVTIAMNGWSDPAPAWWSNLRATPEAHVDLVSGGHPVRARAAEGVERDRLWAQLDGVQGWGDDLDALSGLRRGQTPVVVLEPR
ncbi:MAG TPA: nitroreductase/quinone reductase family protein [Rhodoglobus sp.]|nr:nitroreductase/quinone reductase family protein [Rhodoglobus sp.]